MLSRLGQMVLLAAAFIGAVQGQIKCTAPVNLGISVDQSASIGATSFDVVKMQIAAFIDSSSATTPGNKYYVNKFATVLDTIMPGLQHNTKKSVSNVVRNTPYAVQRSTNIAVGLEDLRAKLSANDIAILFTDGKSNAGNNPVTVATEIKAKGITVIAVGIGAFVSLNELTRIASPGLVFTSDAFTGLQAALDKALVVACPCSACASCQTRTIGHSISQNEYRLNTTMAKDAKSIVKAACQVASGVGGTINIQNNVTAYAKAVAEISAKATAIVMGTVQFKGQCAAGTAGGVLLNSTAVASARSIASGFTSAFSEIVGFKQKYRNFVEAQSTAIADICARAIVSASASGIAVLNVTTAFPDWTSKLYINSNATVEAISKAVAESYSQSYSYFKLKAEGGEYNCTGICSDCPAIVLAGR